METLGHHYLVRLKSDILSPSGVKVQEEDLSSFRANGFCPPLPHLIPYAWQIYGPFHR